MGISIALGICAGFVGFIPMVISMWLSRRNVSTHVVRDAALYGLGGVFVSLVVVVVAMLICALVNRPMVTPFGVAEILSLIICTSVYFVLRNKSYKG